MNSCCKVALRSRTLEGSYPCPICHTMLTVDPYLLNLSLNGGFPQHCQNNPDGPICNKPQKCVQSRCCQKSEEQTKQESEQLDLNICKGPNASKNAKHKWPKLAIAGMTYSFGRVVFSVCDNCLAVKIEREQFQTNKKEEIVV